MEKIKILYNFDLSRYKRRDTKRLEERRREKIAEELMEIEANRWWEIESSLVRFLYLTGEEGFLDVGSLTPWRAYTVEEVKKEAIAIYIASAKKADDVTRESTPAKVEKYIKSLRRVEPQGIGIPEMIRMIGEVQVRVSITEYYEASRIESETEFIPDLYEVIAILDSESQLFQREFSDCDGFSEAILLMEREGRYTETFHTLI